MLDWLLDADPSIRWQTLRDLRDAPADVVETERARVAAEGWGARLLALQGEDGLWAGGALFPARDGRPLPWNRSEGQPWTATAYSLVLLRDCGVDPDDARVRRAVALVRDNCRWEHAGQPFFTGEVEPCINGMVVALGAYFEQDVDGVVDRLRRRAARGRRLELRGRERFGPFVVPHHDPRAGGPAGPRAGDRRIGRSPRAARRRGEEYLLERTLFRRKSTGEVVDPAWLRFSFPTRWHYDVLRGLEYFRTTGDRPDPRIDEAIHLVRSKQQPDGTWLLENTHRARSTSALDDGDGQPSRWNTLRALRVLRWYDRSLA